MRGTTNCSTTPRKRRPRAVGEVFITSESCVYLSEELAVGHTAATLAGNNSNDEFDVVYENAPIRPHRNKQMTKPTLCTNHAFNTCRISEVENPVGATQTSDVTATSAGLSNMTETQLVYAFIGEN